MSDDEGLEPHDEGLVPTIAAEQTLEGSLKIVASGNGQRVVVILDDGEARTFADDVLEIVEGPLMHRTRPAPDAGWATIEPLRGPR